IQGRRVPCESVVLVVFSAGTGIPHTSAIAVKRLGSTESRPTDACSRKFTGRATLCGAGKLLNRFLHHSIRFPLEDSRSFANKNCKWICPPLRTLLPRSPSSQGSVSVWSKRSDHDARGRNVPLTPRSRRFCRRRG